MRGIDVWTYREVVISPIATVDFVGYKVEALDGSIGKVDEATYDAGSAYIIVDTGPWIFGKKVMLPAGVIERIDPDAEKVYVELTKDQIENAPEYDEPSINDPGYRGRLGSYYEEQAQRAPQPGVTPYNRP
jgi:hypothetical protein